MYRRDVLKGVSALGMGNCFARLFQESETKHISGCPQYGYNPANTHSTTDESAPENGVEKKWYVDQGGTTPIVSDNVLYYPTQGKLYALDPQTGDELWNFKTPNGMGYPAIQENTVFVLMSGGSIGPILHALSADDGEKKWDYQLPGEVTWPTINNGTLYITSYDAYSRTGYVIAVSSETGEKLWQFELDGVRGNSTPAVKDGSLYWGVDLNYSSLFAIDSSNGEQQWRYDGENHNFEINNPSVADDTIVFTCRRNSIGNEKKVYAISANDGTQKWTFASEELLFHNSVAISDGSVYVPAGNNDELHSFDLNSGEREWTISNRIFKSSPVVVGDTVYVVGDGRVLAISTGEGTIQWSSDMYDMEASSPLVVDNMVYLNTMDGLYALSEKTENEQLTDKNTISKSKDTESIEKTQLNKQQGQNEQELSNESNNDDGGEIPILNRFSDDHGSVWFGIGIAGVLSGSGYMIYRRSSNDKTDET